VTLSICAHPFSERDPGVQGRIGSPGRVRAHRRDERLSGHFAKGGIPFISRPLARGYNPDMDTTGGSLCPMCGASISQGVTICTACGEKLRSRSEMISRRLNWRERAGTPAAILMFLVGFCLLCWAAVKFLVVIVAGGSLSDLWALLAAAVLPFLVGWDFLPRTKRSSDPPSTNSHAESNRPV
jgi:hypothetical protein